MSCLQNVVEEIEENAENRMKIYTSGAMEWGLISGPVLYVSCWQVLSYPTSHSRGVIMNVTTGKVPWMVLGEL